MKYHRLTKEQFSTLHYEFARFLATQSIDKADWEKMKSEKPDVAEAELDVFSDLVWEGALNQAKYLDQISKSHVFLFGIHDTFMSCIVIKSLNTAIDFTTQEGFNWLTSALLSEDVEWQHGKKTFTDEKNKEVFSLIRQGAQITDGQLYKQLYPLIEQGKI
ncbi:MAG: hypothetical protein CFE24_00055 [Flavobacterium sp. BFFFF2]|nr:MAG: hypothetical protein CFE24_00055 [Flavobacterium sp. BFFFF2]